MLDTDTKRRIDNARDILVGKVPDPKSQVEQITIALIYKFMDDIDSESEELGGERTFFAGEFARYGWSRLMRSGLSGHEMLGLYAEAIARMPENPGIPPLFRSIFDNAYLPYRDPETLRAFLKIIDEFSYDHSERLGDAYEYLLQIMGAQGDAGQFRTPRHIIDFIVAIVDPQKHESVLDPACGTAGFLISAYKFILAANTDDDGNTTLTPDERNRLAASFKGYDISPDMVRLSRVNMYLHDFADPHIVEYDTLTSEERWTERADVILANPPFMSPKGGIRPHNRFSVKSKRSEVLFVDYMAEHLTPTGRAGIIVPEGIVFQSQNAHKQLRKMLVEDCLVAVVSLPGGVFKPYSGVKTSILILDRSLARRTDRIAFFKVENDGFDLGDQRRPIDWNDLPQVQAEISEYLRSLRAAEPADTSPAVAFSVAETRAEYTAGGPKLGMVIEKAKIAADGGYALSGERYRETEVHNAKWPMVKLKDVCDDILSGGTPSTKNEGYWKGDIPWITSADIVDIKSAIPRRYITEKAIRESATNLIEKGNVIVVTRVGLGKLFKNDFDVCISQDSQGLIVKDRVSADFLAWVLKDRVEGFKRVSQGSTIQGVTKKQLSELEIPLPPLEVQKEIVAEIVGYQKVMDGARAVIDNYRPHIPIDPDWPLVELGEVVSLEYGKPLKLEDRIDGPHPVFGSNGIVGHHNQYLAEGPTIVVGRKGSAGAVKLSETACYPIDTTFYVKIREPNRLDIRFCYYQFLTLELDKVNVQSGVPGLNRNDAYRKPMALPPLETQQSVVAEIETEQALVSANRELAERMERRIVAAIGRVWGEEQLSESGFPGLEDS